MACSESSFSAFPPLPVSRRGRGIFLLLCLMMILLLASCTDYERAGVNPRPFNEPTEWEQNPYGDAFRN